MNYFRSEYDIGVVYSENWYGSLSYAPKAEVLLYNDNKGFCVGRMEEPLPIGVIPLTEEEANAIVANAVDADGVYFGEKLLHRWNAKEEIVAEVIANG